MVEVIAAQRGIPAGRQHFKYPAAQAQDRDIKCPAAEIVNRDHPFLTGIEAVGNRRRRRFVQQTQHVQARQTRGVFGALTLCIIKVGRNGDHHAVQIAAERGRSTLRQRFEDVSRNTNRVQQTGRGRNHRQAVFTGLQLIRQMRVAGLNIGQRAAHHALDGADGIRRIARGVSAGVIADRVTLLLVVDHGRQQMAALLVSQRFRLAAAHGRHEGIGGTQINTHRQTTLVRCGT
ncbi:hypothetical protein EKINANG_13530 [Enterobacter sp. KINAN-G]|nr:hypothetical protein EKINANG_13530 [Enterobacter sp. KINAN-G]